MHEIDWEPAEVNSNPHNFDQSWEIDFKTFTNILGLHYFQNFNFQNIYMDIIMLLIHCRKLPDRICAQSIKTDINNFSKLCENFIVSPDAKLQNP